MDTGGFVSGGGSGHDVRDTLVARSRAEVDATLAVAAFDAERAWQLDGARSPVTWLAGHCHISRPDAVRLLRRARLMGRLDRVADAFAVGKLSLGAGDLLAAAVTRDRVELAERDQEVILDAALGLSIVDLERYLAHWRSLADDELADTVVPPSARWRSPFGPRCRSIRPGGHQEPRSADPSRTRRNTPSHPAPPPNAATTPSPTSCESRSATSRSPPP